MAFLKIAFLHGMNAAENKKGPANSAGPNLMLSFQKNESSRKRWTKRAGKSPVLQGKTMAKPCANSASQM
jgi:hypothetical protein